tara:strand:+ start:404 stop:505 length:102 start_codon:yes stop_codon:yes gene_type:complete
MKMNRAQRRAAKSNKAFAKRKANQNVIPKKGTK